MYNAYAKNLGIKSYDDDKPTVTTTPTTFSPDVVSVPSVQTQPDPIDYSPDIESIVGDDPATDMTSDPESIVGDDPSGAGDEGVSAGDPTDMGDVTAQGGFISKRRATKIKSKKLGGLASRQ